VIRSARAALAAAALITFLATGCAPTTYDESVVAESVAPTSSTLPTGTATELLPALVQETGTLSEIIANKGDKQAAVQRIEALWAAVADEVSAARPDLAADMATNVARCADAAQFNRPADADKALRNLTVLVEAYLA
jgi:hypothetical protein